MLAHASEIRQTLDLINQARAQLDARGFVYGPVRLGAMIEIPAAALTVPIKTLAGSDAALTPAAQA